MNIKNNHLVIMAGGVGSRFWPMSTPDYPDKRLFFPYRNDSTQTGYQST